MPEAIPRLPSPRTSGDEAGATPTDSSAPRRYPLQPLLDRMGGSRKSAARRLRISGSTEQDYRRRGVTERVADRLAVKANLNPYEVWPEMADHLIEDNQRTCARPGCDTKFQPVHRQDQKYCSNTCRRSMATKRYRQRKRASDPQWVESMRAKRRAYYAECADYERADRRRRYAASTAQGTAA